MNEDGRYIVELLFVFPFSLKKKIDPFFNQKSCNVIFNSQSNLLIHFNQSIEIERAILMSVAEWLFSDAVLICLFCKPAVIIR